MKAKIKQIILIILLLITFNISGQNIRTGAEKTEMYLPILKDKRIAIVGNQTSRIGKMHLVDTLLSLKLDIKKVFSPEHGFRGNADAGQKVENERDAKTGLEIISLYGKNKKPTTKQLENIDILVFDIQDVGVRFYTYISTLHYIMEAASENNTLVMILDRPNPNGHYIDGPIREENYKSFVGMHPVPIVYGMTIGEYGKMIIGEKWINKKCDLTVIKMDNYKHSLTYELPIRPSPNLPNKRAINLYPSLCLFEGTNVSVGRGTNDPFQHFGAPYIKSKYHFTPKSSFGSQQPKHNGKKCYGTDLRYQTYMQEINLNWLIDTYNKYSEKEEFFNNFFDKLAGTNTLREQIISGKKPKEIKATWQSQLDDFKQIRSKYLLY